MKRLCVILSGSGLSGYASVALVEFLRKYKIIPNQLIGCSTGALISALWACNFSNDEIHQHIYDHYDLLLNKEPDYTTPLSLFKAPGGTFKKDKAFYNVTKLKNLLARMFAEKKLEHCDIPTIIQTTNIDTGTPFQLQSGLINEAVYASSAMLPFYPATQVQDHWLADGSFTAPIPISSALEQNFDVILVLMPETIYENGHLSFMAYYSNFVQKAIKHLNATQNIISLYLQHEEVIIIPVTLQNIDYGAPPEIEYLIKQARKEIEKKETTILEKILD